MRKPDAFMEKRIVIPSFLILFSLFCTPSTIFGQLQWKCATSNPPFAIRGFHSSVAFDNKLWVLNGMNADKSHTDIWSTTDGVNWTCANSNVPYPMRTMMGTLIFDGYLWIIGGGEGC